MLPDLELRLTGYLRCAVTLEIAAAEDCQDGTNMETEDRVGQLVRFSLPGVAGAAAVSLGPRLVALLLDLVLGGDGSRIEPVTRPCTDLERSLIRPFHEILAGAVAPLFWTGQAPVIEEGVQAGGEDKTGSGGSRLGIRVKLKCQQTAEVFELSFPLSWVVESAPPEQPPDEPGQGGLASIILDQLEGSPVTVEAVLTGISVRIADLLDLRAADVLLFDCSADAPLLLSVNGWTCWIGSLRDQNGKKVFEIGGRVSAPHAQLMAS